MKLAIRTPVVGGRWIPMEGEVPQDPEHHEDNSLSDGQLAIVKNSNCQIAVASYDAEAAAWYATVSGKRHLVENVTYWAWLR